MPGVRKCKLDGDAAFAAIATGYRFLWVRCPACQMVSAIDLRGLDRHPRRGGNEPHPSFVPPLMPAERTIC
jgi:hypothetical protein